MFFDPHLGILSAAHDGARGVGLAESTLTWGT
jgi:hypothetical protein